MLHHDNALGGRRGKRGGGDKAIPELENLRKCWSLRHQLLPNPVEGQQSWSPALSPSTTLPRAVACAIAAEGVLPITYQAPFGSLVQEILSPPPHCTPPPRS